MYNTYCTFRLTSVAHAGTQENTRLPRLSTEFDIRVGSVDEIIQHISAGQHERCILLPQHSQAVQLFNAYVEQVDPMQHVIHVPSVRRAIERLYARMQVGERIEPNDAVLISSILASISSYWSPAEPTGIFDTVQSACNATHHWLKTTLDILEHVKRTSSATLETVQASAVLAFLIYHMEGFSPKVRAILAGALSAARDLGLHRTDSHIDTPQQESQMDVVYKEMCRRVWWHLAGTDWSMTLCGGPHEGSYNVNPRHMKVKRPRNISDDELEGQSPDFEHGYNEPTIMAYFLQRIRLSEISRDMVDLNFSGEADDIAVEKVAEIDSRFQIMLAELPTFLRTDYQSIRKTHELEKSHRHIGK